MKEKQQAILARDMIDMIRDYQDNADVLEYLESFAFSIARIIESEVVVDWDNITGVCDQRYYSLKQGNPVPLIRSCSMNASGKFSHTFQPRRMTNNFLEQFYENVILPCYKEAINLDDITWIDHGKVGLDTWAHYFECNGKEYVLVYEDFPGNTDFDDGLSHEAIKCGDETSIELRFNDDARQVPNVTGWFTLFREK